jgi:putative addiction module antidote
MVNKVLRVGDSAAITIPKQTLKDMGIKIGDKVTVTFMPELNEIVVKPHRPQPSMVSERVIRLTTQFMDTYRAALQQLAH